MTVAPNETSCIACRERGACGGLPVARAPRSWRRTLARLAGSAPTVAPALCAAVIAGSAGADEPAARERGVLSLLIQNDVFAGLDEQYTNGTYLRYAAPPNQLPAVGRFLRRQADGLVEADTWRMTYGIGQSMFAPDDLTLRDPPLDDRPYAGFLFGTIAISADTGRRLDTLALDIGVTGPPSLAEQTQTLVHHVMGDDPKGWDTQLETEVAFRFVYERMVRYGTEVETPWGGLELDAIPQVSAAAGTLDVSLAGVLTVRAGQDLDIDYGPQRVRRSVAGIERFDADDRSSWYVFAGVEGRAVGRNLFLDGNTFRDSRSVDKETFIGDVQLGAAMQFGGVLLTYTHVFRSPEFETRDNWTQFGSLAVQIGF